jgi:hypothetical protein
VAGCDGLGVGEPRRRNLWRERIGDHQIERLCGLIGGGVAQRRDAPLGVERDRRKREAEEKHPLVGSDMASDLLRKRLERVTIIEAPLDLILQHHERRGEGDGADECRAAAATTSTRSEAEGGA